MYICQLCMAHITLSIPDEIYTEMKKHPEIKWSEIARQNIVEKTLLMKRGLHTKEIFKILAKDDYYNIRESSAKNPNAPKEVLEYLAKDENYFVRG